MSLFPEFADAIATEFAAWERKPSGRTLLADTDIAAGTKRFEAPDGIGPNAGAAFDRPDRSAVADLRLPGYEIIEELGRAVGVVYLARRRGAKRLVASR